MNKRKESRFEKLQSLIGKVQKDYKKWKKPGMANSYIVHRLASKHGRSERRIYQILKLKDVKS